MQALSGLEGKGVPGGIHNLIGPADQMHFHAGQFRVPDRQVVERVKIEIPAELAIDASQQVLVEPGGDALCVVIGSDERRFVLDQIRPDQQQGLIAQQLPHRAQESQCLGVRQVADGRTGKEADFDAALRRRTAI